MLVGIFPRHHGKRVSVVDGSLDCARYKLDDYCMAAISVYADILRLFRFLLRLFGQRK